MSKEFKLPEKQKYTPKDLFELLACAFDRPWYVDASQSEKNALIEFEKCKEYYTNMLNGLNNDLQKNKPVFIGITMSSKCIPGYYDYHYYSKEKGHFYESVFDGVGID